MLTLYGSKGSGSAAAEAALEVAGLDYRKVDAASWKPSPDFDELKRVNPARRCGVGAALAAAF